MTRTERRTMGSSLVVAVVTAFTTVACGGPANGQGAPQAAPGPGEQPAGDPGPAIAASPLPNPNSLLVTLSGPPGAEIYYVTHAGPPDPAPGAGVRYDGPFVVSALALYEPSLAIVRAVAVVGGTSGTASSRTFPFDTPVDPEPRFAPGPGSYAAPQAVSITSSVPAARIYYTLDGSDPGIQGTPYAGPIVVGTSTTIRAVAVLYNDATPPRAAEYRF